MSTPTDYLEVSVTLPDGSVFVRRVTCAPGTALDIDQAAAILKFAVARAAEGAPALGAPA